MNISIKLKRTSDIYGFEEISCMEKPFGIILDGISTGFANMYYIIIKYIQAYQVQNYAYEEFNAYYSKDVNIKVLKEFFGLNLVYEDVNPDNIIDWIEKRIDSNNVVFVTANLKDLFYSKYYKKGDWGHIFLIHGYDKENQLFNIIDSAQAYKDESAIYKPFVVEYLTMKKMYTSWMEADTITPCYIKCDEVDNISSAGYILKMFAKLYLANCNNDVYKEEKFINNQFLDKENMKVYTEFLLRTRTAKRVFFNELVNIIHKYKIKIESIEAFMQAKDQLIHEWEDITYRLSVKAYRNQKPKNLRGELLKVTQLETSVKQLIAELCHSILQNEFLEDDRKRNNHIENNEDGIINIVDKSNCKFYFNSGKVYSSFGVDDSPKVVLIDKMDANKRYVVKTSVDMEKYQDTSQFMAGIFIRTENNNLYFWGNCCRESIRFDLCGVDNNIFEVDINHDNFNIGVDIRDGIYVTLGYENELGQFVECYQYKLISKAQEMGLACKTWGFPDEIQINYRNFEISCI